MNDVLAISKALSDPGRLRILASLREGEVCVCQIVDLLGLAMSTVSRHLSILAEAGLVHVRRDGRWAWYRLAGHEAPAPVRQALAWSLSALEADPAIAADRARMAEIRVLPPEETARRVCCSPASEASGSGCC